MNQTMLRCGLCAALLLGVLGCEKPPQKRAGVLSRGDTMVEFLAFSPDGRYLASGGDSRVIRVWEVRDGELKPEEVATLKGHTARLSAITFSPDGKTLASGGWDSTVRLWDTATWRERAKLTFANQVGHPVYSPDGKWLVTWDLSADIVVRDAATGKEKFQLQIDGGTSLHYVGARGVAFSPDGRYLVSVGGSDSVIRVWDMATRKEVHHVFAHGFPKGSKGISKVLCSPDGKTIATYGSDGRVRLWELPTVASRGEAFPGYSMDFPFAFSADGRYLVAGFAGEEKDVHEVGIWDVKAGREAGQRRLPPPREYTALAFSPDNKLVVFGTGPEEGRIVWQSVESFLMGR